MNLCPSVPTIDQIVSMAQYQPKVVINGQEYVSRGTSSKYYSNFVKRVIAAFYVVAGKGMVVQYSEDLYKESDIVTLERK